MHLIGPEQGPWSSHTKIRNGLGWAEKTRIDNWPAHHVAGPTRSRNNPPTPWSGFVGAANSFKANRIRSLALSSSAGLVCCLHPIPLSCSPAHASSPSPPPISRALRGGGGGGGGGRDGGSGGGRRVPAPGRQGAPPAPRPHLQQGMRPNHAPSRVRRLPANPAPTLPPRALCSRLLLLDAGSPICPRVSGWTLAGCSSAFACACLLVLCVTVDLTGVRDLRAWFRAAGTVRGLSWFGSGFWRGNLSSNLRASPSSEE